MTTTSPKWKTCWRRMRNHTIPSSQWSAWTRNRSRCTQTFVPRLRPVRGFGASVSPGSSHIAFLNGARSDIWLMGPDAEDPRRVLSGDKETWFSRVEWSPDGRRLAYMKHRRKNGDIAIEILDLPATQPTVVLSDRGLESFCWAPDG